ncbi:endonuclease/exonuclease/phosphatase family protein [Melioribacter sp. OK-6-Me]|uniref:endonuclease/exonuclease/phosphatase family protein n=1 Tax=unclassified Melioribacter TaxID=2627329 RepID=UPI003ED9A22F
MNIKHRLLSSATLLILLALLGCSPANLIKKEEKDAVAIKVMTFNIRYGSAEDGINSWSNRKEVAFDVIRNYYPDLLGMQEVLKFQLDETLDQFPYYAYVGVGRDDGKTGGEYSPLFYLRERFIVDTCGTFWFSDTPEIPGSKSWGNEITRISSWARLFDKFTGNVIEIYNLHLDHKSKESRIKSAQLLLSKINENIPTIITGDFNSSEDEETIKLILNSGFKDTYRFVHAKSSHEGTYHRFIGDDRGDKIDFIFVSNHFKIVDAEIIKTYKLTGNNKYYPSDHFPVVAEVVIDVHLK